MVVVGSDGVGVGIGHPEPLGMTSFALHALPGEGHIEGISQERDGGGKAENIFKLLIFR